MTIAEATKRVIEQHIFYKHYEPVVVKQKRIGRDDGLAGAGDEGPPTLPFTLNALTAAEERYIQKKKKQTDTFDTFYVYALSIDEGADEIPEDLEQLHDVFVFVKFFPGSFDDIKSAQSVKYSQHVEAYLDRNNIPHAEYYGAFRSPRGIYVVSHYYEHRRPDGTFVGTADMFRRMHHQPSNDFYRNRLVPQVLPALFERAQEGEGGSSAQSSTSKRRPLGLLARMEQYGVMGLDMKTQNLVIPDSTDELQDVPVALIDVDGMVVFRERAKELETEAGSLLLGPPSEGETFRAQMFHMSSVSGEYENVALSFTPDVIPPSNPIASKYVPLAPFTYTDTWSIVANMAQTLSNVVLDECMVRHLIRKYTEQMQASSEKEKREDLRLKIEKMERRKSDDAEYRAKLELLNRLLASLNVWSERDVVRYNGPNRKWHYAQVRDVHEVLPQSHVKEYVEKFMQVHQDLLLYKARSTFLTEERTTVYVLPLKAGALPANTLMKLACTWRMDEDSQITMDVTDPQKIVRQSPASAAGGAAASAAPGTSSVQPVAGAPEGKANDAGPPLVPKEQGGPKN
eukprot:g3239.t1